MASVHSRNSAVLASGIFSDLENFAQLEARIAALPEERDRGDAFEVFAGAWLRLFYPEQLRALHFWPLPDSVATTLNVDASKDRGIDSVLETAKGYVAVQVKFRANRGELGWRDLATFIGLSDRTQYRLVVSNGYGICQTALARGRVGFIGAEVFDSLTGEHLAQIARFIADQRITYRPQKPRAHQIEAIEATQQALQQGPRACVLMACGTGKTLIASQLCRAFEKVLITVPSLALLRQHLEHWKNEGLLEVYRPVVVCSDQSTTRSLTHRSDPEADIGVEAVGVQVITDQAEIEREMAASKEHLVVLSTYQSSSKLAQALPSGFRFDLTILDEAHRTAVHKQSHWTTVLDDTRVPSARRVAFTATARHYANAASPESRSFSMDDADVYGAVSYSLGFREAVNRGLVRDYKVVISVVTKSMVEAEALKSGVVLIDGEPRNAFDAACHIAIGKAMQDFGLKKGIAFFSRTKSARRFANYPDVADLYENDPNLFFVTSGLKATDRISRLQQFGRRAEAIMANVRCLGEGVDVPSVDFVAFMTPKSSYIDIVQILGRTLRLHEAKTHGYVILPLFLDDQGGETVEGAIARAGFLEIWNVLYALREQDSSFKAEVHSYLIQEATALASLRDRITVVGGSLDLIALDRLRDGILVRSLECFNETWDVMYARLVEHKAQFDNLRVPEDTELAGWLKVQRVCERQGALSDERRAKLEHLGFEFRPRDRRFERMVAKFVAHLAANGGSDRNLKLDVELNSWAIHLNSKYQHGRLSAEQHRLLVQAGFVFKPVLSSKPQERNRMSVDLLKGTMDRFWPGVVTAASAREYRRRGQAAFDKAVIEGNVVMPQVLACYKSGLWASRDATLRNRWIKRLVAEAGKAATPNQPWVRAQLRALKKGRLDPVQVGLLRAAGLLVETLSIGERLEPTWREYLAQYREFLEEHGRVEVPAEYADLRHWFDEVNTAYQKKKLTPQQHEDFKRVKAPSLWTAEDLVLWEKRYRLLEDHFHLHGHTSMTAGGSDRVLTQWCNQQRTAYRKGTLPKSRQRRLLALRFQFDGRLNMLCANMTEVLSRIKAAQATEADWRWLHNTSVKLTKGYLLPEERELFEHYSKLYGVAA